MAVATAIAVAAESMAVAGSMAVAEDGTREPPSLHPQPEFDRTT